MTETPDTAHPSEVRDPLDEQEDESFPASDPHSDWAGPPDDVERSPGEP